MLHYTFPDQHTDASTAWIPPPPSDNVVSRTVKLAIHDAGYTELGDPEGDSGGGNEHFRFTLPSNTPPPLADLALPPGPLFRAMGSDLWIPKASALADTVRTATRYDGGWERRREMCNGIATCYWWVPEGSLESFVAYYEEHAGE